MSTETFDPAVEETGVAASTAVSKSQKALNEAFVAAQEKITRGAKTAEKRLREQAETLRVKTKPHRDNASAQFDEAQRYVVERVKERPVTAALSGFGIGLLFGLLLSNRNK